VRQHDLHNKHRAIFVAPTFAQLPWYADHPTDPQIRQESYFLQVVVPAVEKHYPARARREGRLLLGFSKSGWGAWSLLLRNPDVFGKAAAWDAPLDMSELGKYGTTPIFATQANFDSYRITELVKQRSQQLAGGPRLILMGHGNFAAATRALHALLDQHEIRHEFRDGPKRPHDWHSGWVAEAVQLLLPQAAR
jgi:enterochelin esterase-like enzyme